MNKHTLVCQLLERLEERQRVMLAAARDTRETATGAEARSEGKYDTRAIEAGYLAGAQQAQVDKLAEDLARIRSATFPDFTSADPVALGALVETDADGETRFFLLSPAAGGETFEFLGCEATVLAPDAPLFQELLGQQAGNSAPDSGLLILAVE